MSAHKNWEYLGKKSLPCRRSPDGTRRSAARVYMDGKMALYREYAIYKCPHCSETLKVVYEHRSSLLAHAAKTHLKHCLSFQTTSGDEEQEGRSGDGDGDEVRAEAKGARPEATTTTTLRTNGKKRAKQHAGKLFAKSARQKKKQKRVGGQVGEPSVG